MSDSLPFATAALAQLGRLAALPNDHDGEGSAALAPQAVAAARAILASTTGTGTFWLAPTCEGGVMLSAYLDGTRVHAEIEPDGSALVSVHPPPGPASQWVSFTLSPPLNNDRLRTRAARFPAPQFWYDEIWNTDPPTGA